MRRFTRLTSGFSRKLENHEAAISLHMAHYNFVRVHETLRCTPAMALGVADHVWTIRELVEAALSMPEPPPLPTPSERPKGMSAARGKGEKRGSGPSRWHRSGLRVIKGGQE